MNLRSYRTDETRNLFKLQEPYKALYLFSSIFFLNEFFFAIYFQKWSHIPSYAVTLAFIVDIRTFKILTCTFMCMPVNVYKLVSVCVFSSLLMLVNLEMRLTALSPLHNLIQVLEISFFFLVFCPVILLFLVFFLYNFPFFCLEILSLFLELLQSARDGKGTNYKLHH